MKVKYILIVILYSFSSLNSSGQNIDYSLKEYFKSYKANILNESSLRAIYDGMHQKDFITHFDRYTTDSSVSIRSEAYRLIGNMFADQKQNSRAVSYLIKGACDSSEVVYNLSLALLSAYSKASFGPEHRAKLLQRVGTIPMKGRLFRLLAYLGDSASSDTLRAYQGRQLSADDRWNLTLSLARVGDATAEAKVAEVLNASTENCRKLISFLPDAMFTKSKVIVDSILRLTISNTMDCVSPNPSSAVKAPLGIYTIPYLAKSIEDFPIEVDETGEFDESIDVALKMLTDWYSAKGSSYRVSTLSF